MPSYTSSSSHRAPAGPWLRTWTVALATLVVFFGAAELTFRARGMKPVYQDTPRLWGYWRSHVNRAGADAVALVGSSRTQLGLDPATMTEAVPHKRFFQLAVNGGTPLPVLEELAADEAFVGTVIVEGYPSALFMTDLERRRAVEPSLQAFDNRPFIEDVEVGLRSMLQGALVVARPEFRPTLFLTRLLSDGRLPNDSYIAMRFNRWTMADFRKPYPTTRRWRINSQEILNEASLEARFRAVDAHVKAIERRGGRVIFFRMPSSGRIREVEQASLPRESYWDKYVASRYRTRAKHFEDYPELASFVCPDGSHLDFRDAPRLSRRLARLLFDN